MPASSEFVTLCRTQVALLIDSFGASLSAIYLTEDPTASGENALIPVVVYPDATEQWSNNIPFQLPEASDRRSALAPPLNPPALSLQKEVPEAVSWVNPLTVFADGPEPTRLVLPLMHEEIIWGLLVVGREGRRWRKREQVQLKQIAQTLAIACVLDQRSQWLGHGHDQFLALQTQQHNTLSTLLHQFRNPLTTLRTLGKLLFKRLHSNDANRGLAESIVSESEHLEQLLRQFDDAIDLGDAALETGEAIATDPPALLPGSHWLTGTLVLQPCWLSEVLQPLLHAIAGRVDEQRMQLQVAIPPELPPVKADATALREVFGNIIDNALKYTSDGGTVWVTVERQVPQGVCPAQQIVQISDNGPGIPAADLERIFERNYRGIQSQTDISGTGLGLAIAKDLMLQMQGDIHAFSPALVPQGSLRTGSTFQVQLSECGIQS
ncbi:MAG: GAF domain-containing sensor histidine kinase [Thermosynechococcaceae cyanobacterium]